MSFSIATLNVHMWVDANHDDNIDRIVQLVKVNLTFLPTLMHLICPFKKGIQPFG